MNNELSFLGTEFLTWLWFKVESGESTFRLDGEVEVGVALSDYLSIAGDDDSTEQTLRKGLPTRAPEATASLACGKRLTRARIIVAEGNEEWALTINGGQLAFSSVRAANSDPDETNDTRDLSRMHSYVRIGEIIDEIYRAFLTERLAPEFSDSVVPKMRAWVNDRQAQLPSTVPYR
ncbi:MAG: hypothetical protein CMJ85_14395 [Planctomycetes bacterium]|jgi:hypothetical protein|nr:hypothetical protein [Planctomycetota bacterium]MDP6424133.1 hypothetical protein [Planctomycetota bacterium]